ncbi:S-methyl-5-thioribose-1-phosphate isomerase, partial [Myxococcota bacterium]|nr:S-methyl-5-thioribose-1-phosphate isomerase [Myxococcota bacterium]MBU1537857.1 S-methyl-5-thioribose-1-phosphate isomerase [Myxococcota bacterium]
WNTRTGEEIVIEERCADEVRRVGNELITVPDVPVFNPAFDVTPAHLIAAIITENGVIEAPCANTMAQFRTSMD